MASDHGGMDRAEFGDSLGSLRRHLVRAALSLVLCGLLVWLLLGRLSAIEPAAVALAFASLPAQSWAMALLATAVSFWAVGQYDLVMHRHFITGLPAAPARLAGICAIAVSQMIGMGVISGAVLRWRMMPDIGAWAAMRLTAAVALSFLGAWAMVTALVLTLLPGAPYKPLAAAVLLFGGALAALSIAAPRLGRMRFRWLNGLTLGRLFGLCLVDTFAAALAFHLLCPAGVDIGFALLLPAFLLALGAGLVSGAPSGMGAFEMTLLALLPAAPEADILAAILAWRIVYFAVPAILGAGIALRGPRPLPRRAAPPDAGLVWRAAAAETQILRQGEHQLAGSAATGVWLAGRTPHFLVGLFAPLCGRADHAMAALDAQAKAEGRLPVLYRVGARQAVAARAAGYKVLPLAREAMLTPGDYSLAAPARAGLRRKLRRAAAAGVQIADPGLAPDWTALEAIARQWARAHGGERGFSMGRYSKPYVQGQRLFVALQGGRPVAFVSCHVGPQEWALDLMRHADEVPDGTMHLLVQAAIDAARAAGVARLSLAAVPESAFGDAAAGPARWLHRFGAGGAPGLMRFKAAFAPQWHRRYLCLPAAAALPLAALEIGRAILRPAPLPLHRPEAPDMPEIDNDHAEYAFASDR